METADGVRVAVHPLGGAGRSLLIAHATGFHGRAYWPFARSLAATFRSEAIDERGHGLSGLPPGLDFDWNGFGRDVLAGVSVLGSGPVVGFGHSCGGAALVAAELARPGTFEAIYCFEPIIFPVEEPMPALDDGPLSIAARRRREVFPSREAAFDNYRSKPPLGALDPESLHAYVDFGFEDLDDGTVRLLCRGENEAKVYAAATLLDVHRRLGEVACRVVFAGGAETDAIKKDHLALLALRTRRSEVDVLDGIGHFGPLEDHQAVAESVLTHLG